MQELSLAEDFLQNTAKPNSYSIPGGGIWRSLKVPHFQLCCLQIVERAITHTDASYNEEM